MTSALSQQTVKVQNLLNTLDKISSRSIMKLSFSTLSVRGRRLEPDETL